MILIRISWVQCVSIPQTGFGLNHVLANWVITVNRSVHNHPGHAVPITVVYWKRSGVGAANLGIETIHATENLTLYPKGTIKLCQTSLMQVKLWTSTQLMPKTVKACKVEKIHATENLTLYAKRKPSSYVKQSVVKQVWCLWNLELVYKWRQKTVKACKVEKIQNVIVLGLTIGKEVPKRATVALRTKNGRLVRTTSRGFSLMRSSTENPVGRPELIKTSPENFSGPSLTTDMPTMPPRSWPTTMTLYPSPSSFIKCLTAKVWSSCV